jgi:hypothetical protein
MSRAARHALIGAVVLVSGCASNPASSPGEVASTAPVTAAKSVPAATDCRPAEVERLRAQLQAEVAERQRVVRAASRREDALRKQLEAMKSIERGILDREDRIRPDTRTETR